jgi:ParB-like chromosome segregation protein Spo0J
MVVAQEADHDSGQGTAVIRGTTQCGTTVPITHLRLGPSPRDGINIRHVAALSELDGEWEPLVVQRGSMVVVDGRHRLAAAKKLGHDVVRVSYFEGTDAEACAEAIRLNVLHGLPLTLSERTGAARHLIGLFPHWSDRHVSSICALSPRTIARIRSQYFPRPQPETPEAPGALVVEKRIGKDGRRYPSTGKAIRSEIGRILQEEGNVSLRSVAARTGVSPETVRTVRRSLAAQHEGISASQALLQTSGHPDEGAPKGKFPTPLNWLEDSACSSTPEGREFADWFEGRGLDSELLAPMAQAVPLSRVYDAIDEARRRAALWETFAKVLQERICRRGVRGA